MNATANLAATAAASHSRQFLGHPRGLAYIAFTEAWERFSFYGMQALLMLYMTGYLLQPGVIEGVLGFAALRAGIEGVVGQLSPQALASQIFGLYVALIYVTPIIGGLIGDHLIGRTRAVLAGAVLMAAGHFMMALEAAFLPALAALILGSGLLKGNLAAQVGGLYTRDDRRRDGAYTIYMTAVNVGAFVAPLVCGTLGELWGWHYGFGVAGIGMLIGIAIYITGRRHLPPDTLARHAGRARLERDDARVIFAIVVLFAITSLFWTIQAQIWNVYPLWLRDHVDRDVGSGLMMPVTWFQALDSMAVLVLAPLTILYWRWQGRRNTEPGDLTKIAYGCGLYGASCLLLGLGHWLADGGPVALVWPVLFHFVVGVGYLYAAPIALALVSRAAPPAVNAMLVGAFYLGIVFGGLASGWLARFYEPLGPTAFWFLHVLVGGAGMLLVMILRRWFLSAMRLDATAAG